MKSRNWDRKVCLRCDIPSDSKMNISIEVVPYIWHEFRRWFANGDSQDPLSILKEIKPHFCAQGLVFY
jgi:hypothetical protein